MYDAISSGLTYLARGGHPRRVLVLVGDGGDCATTMSFDQITCCPFNFVGPAPRRFGVHAERVRGASDFRTSA